MNRGSALLATLIFAALISLPWIGDRQFYTRGEPREALVPKKMLETSNWILPRTFDDRVPSKPPFTHWLIGASAWLHSIATGRVEVDEWSARFPAAALSLLFLALLYRFIEPRLGAERALHSVLILLTSLEWLRGMVSARVDTVLSVTLGAALLALFSFSEKRSLAALAAGIAALSAATLTKGPVALVLPAALLAVYHWSTFRALGKTVLMGLQFFAPALILSSTWYLLAYQVGGDDFLNKFWYENVQRFASSTDDAPHDHSVFYLLLMLIVGMLPWSLAACGVFLRGLLPHKRLDRYRAFYRSLEPIEKFSLIVVAGFFLFFSIPSSKRGVYLLPSFPFAAVLLSRVTTAPLSALFRKSVRWVCASALAAGVILIVGLAAAPYLPALDPLRADFIQAERASILFRPLSWLLILIIFVYARYFFRTPENHTHYFVRLGFLCCAMLAFVQGPLVSGFAAAVSERRLAEQLRALDTALPLYSYQFEYYGTIFYLGRPVSLTGWNSASHGLILLKERDYDRFIRDLGQDGVASIIGKSAGSVVKIGDRVLIVEFGRSGAQSLPV